MNVPRIAWWSRTTRKPNESADDAAGQDEFDALVQRQARFVFRVAYAVLRNSYDAEDIVQETFLKIFRSKAWQRMEDEKAFLARTAWRVAVERRPKRQSASDGAEVLLDDFASVDASPEDAAISANSNAVIHRMIDSLPEELRQPLALSAIEELNSREIAETMGIAEGTVRTRLMRARQLLKEKLAALGAAADLRGLRG